MLDYLVDESGTVKGLYYVPEGIGGDGKTYIYDTLTDTVYRINGISLRWKTVHSYKYGCIVMGNENKNVFEEEKYLFVTESKPVTINGETYYAPNLEGFNGLTTQAAYYSQDDKETLEVSISLHMATSLDWGAVAYLAQSRYGANSSNVTKNTTGNQTGVMNLDSYTQTATI